jgi:rubrerythrin
MKSASIGRLTRRELVASGIAAAALAAWGAGADAAHAADLPEDSELLGTALGLELLLVYVYRHVLASGTLTARPARIVRELLQHEKAHARALTAALRQTGHRAAPGPVDVRAADEELAARGVSPSLAGLRTEHDSLRLLLDAEEIAEGVYYRSLSKLSEPEHIRLAAGILAAEAQHATVLSELLKPGDVDAAVPDAFVQGKQ